MNTNKFFIGILFTCLIFLFSMACQNSDGNLLAKNEDSIVINKPNESFNVKKYYDGAGNQIGYDSVYTYSYSYSGSGQMPKEIDSIFNSLQNNFYMPNFEMFFSPEGLKFDDQFFSNPYGVFPNMQNSGFDMDAIIQKHQMEMERMQKMMDSIRNLKIENKPQKSNTKTYTM